MGEYPAATCSRFYTFLSFLLNLKKTEYVIFHKRSIIVEKRDLYVNNILIANTNNVRYLGLTLDDTLSWNGHIDSDGKKCPTGYLYYLDSEILYPLIV